MTILKTRETISITVRLPRHAWPEVLNTTARHTQTAVSLLRGRLTCRQAVLLVRVEGSFHEIQEALYYWECCSFKVEEGDRCGIQDSLHAPGNRKLPSPHSNGRGSPSWGSRGLLSGAAKLASEPVHQETSRRPVFLNNTFGTLRVDQEVGS